MQSHLRRIWSIALPVLIVAATVAIVFLLRGGLSHGERGGDFTLKSASGDVSLHDFAGKWVFIYFGYTFCPDVCPTSLSVLSQAMRTLSPEELERVQGIFVSVDPDRDTPERLKEYAAYFHPKIIGVTGPSMTLALITSRYGSTFRKKEVKSAAGYLVDHSSVIYLVAPNGQLIHEFPHGTTSEEIVTALREHLKYDPNLQGEK